MGKLGLLLLVLTAACANTNDAKVDPLSDYGSGKYIWLPEEENTCIVKYVDPKDVEYAQIYIAEKTKMRCDQIAGTQFFAIETLDERANHTKAIRAFRDWLRQQRKANATFDYELAECFVKDRMSFVRGSFLATDDSNALLGAKLEIKSKNCPLSFAEIEFESSGRYNVNIAPLIFTDDPLE